MCACCPFVLKTVSFTLQSFASFLNLTDKNHHSHFWHREALHFCQEVGKCFRFPFFFPDAENVIEMQNACFKVFAWLQSALDYTTLHDPLAVSTLLTEPYLQSGGTAWGGWRRKPRSRSRTPWCGWSLRRRSRCSRWSTSVPGSDPADHSCP